MSYRRAAEVRRELVAASCVLGLAVGVAISLAWPSIGGGWPGTGNQQILAPSPQYSPEEVVRLQLQSLADSGTNEAAIAQCYALASPVNRSFTGPLSRFTQMLRGPQYTQLLDHSMPLVGATTTSGDHATLLVSMIGTDHSTSVYRFFLSRQKNSRYENCWMTDAVLLEHRFTPQSRPPSMPTSTADGDRSASVRPLHSARRFK